jgi:ATP-dependent DNA ligase
MDPVPAFNAIIAQHGEGLVIKDTHASYLPDKKPIGNWIKVKKQITLDAVVMDYDKEGSGKNAGLIKSVTVGLYINGKLTPIGQVNSGIDDALRVELTTRMEFYKGYVMEIEAMDYNFKHNTMRHARFIRFRDDKLYTKCVPEAIREHSMEPID